MGKISNNFLVIWRPWPATPVTVDQIKVIGAFSSKHTLAAVIAFHLSDMMPEYLAKHGPGVIEVIETKARNKRILSGILSEH